MKRRALVTTGLAFGAGVFIARRSYAQGGTLNLYSARHYNTDEALYGNFADLTGIKINRVDAEPDPLVQRLKAEGDKSPCDVLITTDAGRIERAREMGLLQSVNSAVLAKAVPAHLRDPDNSWFGFSKRARVIFYNKEKVTAADAPKTYEDLADAKWKGKILIRPSGHIYNQSLVGSILAADGLEKTEAWAKAVAGNLARPPRGGDTDQIKGVAAGQAEIAVANTYYYVNLLRSKKPEDREVAAKVGVVFPNQANRGTHVNISGGAVAKHAPNKEAAVKFLEYLVSPQAQRYFAEGNSEFPVVAGVELSPELKSLGTFKEDQLNARVFAQNNAEALKIMDRAGWK
ncbi:MAG: Fe(3+) ABC transporter substrate-binding protein [Proteobacteria bacterium]|uniref:Fe(3+) ABC transporter substrate-binding protein n=1 Tax=Reyranella massiliensis TaxID=445220 RepID=UPI0002FE22EF|nr:Fe(3+) ABC transporter substrate-binding protein [Reyranella massiliensis]MCA0249729.1 Fe(3+) ABC transporter substrate-binding protein [Pseudomonadota bacterium]